MSTPNPPPAPSENGRPAKPAATPAAVIRRLDGYTETGQERFVKKHLPAWVVSGMLNLGILATAYFISNFYKTVEAKQVQTVLATSVEKEDDTPDKDLTNEDPGLESNLAAALPDIEREAEKTVDAVVSEDSIGRPDATMMDSVAYAPPGAVSDNMTAGALGDTGPAMQGEPGGGGSNMAAGFNGRSGATKSRLLREGGGNDESERAVAAGLAWLARQQKQNGAWVFDGSSSGDTIAATGMSLLPFLAAGQTHRSGTKYSTVVDRGLKYLISNTKSDGQINGPGVTMYSQGIAATAMCEAYGMTKDRRFLLRPAQAAATFICAKQGADGSWGYSPGTAGDTSIVGWNIQALKAAMLSKDIIVPDVTINKAIAFLDKVSSGSRKAVYGYAAANGGPGTSLTAVGLLCRYYISKWGPGNAGLAEGVDGLVKRGPGAAPAKPDMYYFYYATQVVHFADGPDWKNWNEGAVKGGKRVGGMRDWLINLQTKKDGAPTHGSWEPDAGTIGGSCGRVGSTALSLLTLEVYYRHLPLYKRDQGGLKVLDAVK